MCGLRSVEFASYDLLESTLEIFVEVGIYDGVEERVGVSQPVYDCPQPVGHVAAFRAERQHECDDKKGQPAENESSHDDTQCFHRLAFPRHRDFSLRPRVLVVHVFIALRGGLWGVGQRQVRFGGADNFYYFKWLALLSVFHRAVYARRAGLRLVAALPAFPPGLPVGFLVEDSRRHSQALLGTYWFIGFLHRLSNPKPSSLEYSPIQDQHKDERDVKSPKCGVDGVARVLADDARVGVRPVFGTSPA